MLQLCVYIYVSIYMYILFQIIFHCGLFENIEYSSICYKLLKFLIEFEILLIRFGIQWIILLLLSSSLGMPPYSFLASIVFAKKLTHNVVNNLFVVSSLSFWFQGALFVFWQIDYNVSQCGYCCIHSSWSSLHILFV